jgi:hypothetical protein
MSGEDEARPAAPAEDLLPPTLSPKLPPAPQTPVPPADARRSRPRLETPRGTVLHTLAGHVTADYSQLRATRLQGPLFDLGSEPGWLPEALGLQSEEGESEHPGSAQLRHYLERQGVTTGRQFVAQFEDKHQSFREVISSIWLEESVVEALTTEEWKTIINVDKPPPLDAQHVRQRPDGTTEVYYKHVVPHVPAKKLRTAVHGLCRQARVNVKTAGREDDLDAWLEELDPTMSLVEELSRPLREKLGVVSKSDLTDPTLSELKNIKKLFEERESKDQTQTQHSSLPGSLSGGGARGGRRDGRKRLPPIVGERLKPAPKNDFLRAVMHARGAHMNGSGPSRKLELSGGDCTAQIWRAVSDLNAKEAEQFKPYDGVRCRFSFKVPAEFIVPHTAKQVAAIFDEYDSDESGALEADELSQLLSHLGLKYDEETVKNVLAEELTAATRGNLSKRSFLNWWGVNKVGKYWDLCVEKAEESKLKDGPAALSMEAMASILTQHVPELITSAAHGAHGAHGAGDKEKKKKAEEEEEEVEKEVIEDIHSTLTKLRFRTKEAFVRWWLYDKTSGRSVGELFDNHDADFSRTLDTAEACKLMDDVLPGRHNTDDVARMLEEAGGGPLEDGISRSTFIRWWAKNRAHSGLCTVSNNAEAAWINIDQEGNGTVQLFAQCCKKHHLEGGGYGHVMPTVIKTGLNGVSFEWRGWMKLFSAALLIGGWVMLSSGIFYLCESGLMHEDHQAYVEGLAAFQVKHNVSSDALRELIELVGAAELDQYEDVATAVGTSPWGYNFPDLYTSMSSFAVITTIGYGKVAPQTSGGKAWLIACVFLGIPTTAWALSAFSKAILSWLDRSGKFLCFPLGTIGANEAQLAFEQADKNKNNYLSKSEVAEVSGKFLGVSRGSNGNCLATWCDEDFLESAFSNDGKGNMDSDINPQFSLDDFKHIVQVLHLPYSNVSKEQNREVVALLLLVGWLFIGSTVYWLMEGWSFGDAFYFCVVTLSTVGLGDMAPDSWSAVAFSFIFDLVGLEIFVRHDNMRTQNTGTSSEH